LEAGRFGVAAGYLAVLTVIFMAMSRIVLRMTYGGPTAPAAGGGERAWTILPPLALILAVFILGVAMPSVLKQALTGAARAVGAP
jgi:formate hydrogenlyase subunit 3/multisubunit Na+/H+ antiporter MnhD subunit